MIKRLIKKIKATKVEAESNKVLNKGNKYFFVHLPKTAGTSFRAAFENNYKTYSDYGSSAKKSTPILIKYIYHNKDHFSFKKHFHGKEDAWITGHVSLVKYLDIVPVTHTITFLRHPVSRTLSQYAHHVRHLNYTGTLEDFIKKPATKSLQSKSLSSLPLGLMGFVGLTERYDESIGLINQQYSLDLSVKAINVNKSNKKSINDISDENMSIILKNNRSDLLLYQEAEFLFQQRIAMRHTYRPWTYAFIDINRKGLLHGCAYQHNIDTPVKLLIKLNGINIQTVIAKDFYNAHPKANFPRDRYIGFSYKLPDTVTTDDQADIYVEATGQKLNFKPLQLK